MASRIQALVETVRAEARRREETDRVVSVGWIVAPVLGVLVFLLVFLVGFLIPEAEILVVLGLGGAFGIALLVGLILLYLYYVLIKRSHLHFARQTRLWEAAVSVLREAAQAQGVDVEAKIISIERTVREARDEETEKGAVLWLVLALLTGGIAALYIFYFLMRDFQRHERRVDNIVEDVNDVLQALGQMELPKRTEQIPKRSFAVYLVLSVITLGLFAIYWIYTLILDPNVHFGQEGRLEDELVSRLEAVAR